MPARHRLESFGQQLTIDNVQFDDAGNYECRAINDLGAATRSFSLRVYCKLLFLTLQYHFTHSGQSRIEELPGAHNIYQLIF